jgi:hypothetical protein
VEEPIRILWRPLSWSNWQEQMVWSFTSGKTGAIFRTETFTFFEK